MEIDPEDQSVVVGTTMTVTLTVKVGSDPLETTGGTFPVGV